VNTEPEPPALEREDVDEVEVSTEEPVIPEELVSDDHSGAEAEEPPEKVARTTRGRKKSTPDVPVVAKPRVLRHKAATETVPVVEEKPVRATRSRTSK